MGIDLLLCLAFAATATVPTVEEGFDPWSILGFSASILFGIRFFVQWLASEKKKESVMPISFWWISIAASVIQIVYVLHLWQVKLSSEQAVPLLIMPCGGLLPYIRNLMIIHQRKTQAHSPPATPPTP